MEWDDFFRMILQGIIILVVLFIAAAAVHVVWEKYRETRLK